jgi:hypothetical protein
MRAVIAAIQRAIVQPALVDVPRGLAEASARWYRIEWHNRPSVARLRAPRHILGERSMELTDLLDSRRPLPSGGGGGLIVQWHAFRGADEAQAFAGHIGLGAGQRVVGGWDEDSVGRIFWVGVEVDDPGR